MRCCLIRDNALLGVGTFSNVTLFSRTDSSPCMTLALPCNPAFNATADATAVQRNVSRLSFTFLSSSRAHDVPHRRVPQRCQQRNQRRRRCRCQVPVRAQWSRRSRSSNHSRCSHISSSSSNSSRCVGRRCAALPACTPTLTDT